MTTINPYLNFNGNCEEVFNFYKSVFGGEFTTLQRYKDVPSGTPSPTQASEDNMIMHVSLPVGDSVLMGSDVPAAMPAAVEGTNFSISYNPQSEEETSSIFYALSEGGRITMPLEKTFWGAFFGMCTDKFGINWMVNYDMTPQQ